MTTGLYGSEPGKNMPAASLLEAIGTAILLAAPTAIGVQSFLADIDPLTSLMRVAVVFGVTLGCLVNFIGPKSGGHFNPAVTLALAATGNFPWKYLPLYWLAQVGGATGGTGLVWFWYGDDARDIARLAVPAPTVDFGRAVSVEAVATFILMFAIMAASTDDRVHKAVAGVTVGSALFIGILLAGTLTGGALNPARAYGPMIVLSQFDFMSFAIYLLGPTLGALLAALFHGALAKKAEDPANLT